MFPTNVLSVSALSNAGRARGLPSPAVADEAGDRPRPSSFIHIGVVDSRIAALFGTRAVTGLANTSRKEDGRAFSAPFAPFSLTRLAGVPPRTSQSKSSFFRFRLARERRKTVEKQSQQALTGSFNELPTLDAADMSLVSHDVVTHNYQCSYCSDDSNSHADPSSRIHASLHLLIWRL